MCVTESGIATYLGQISVNAAREKIGSLLKIQHRPIRIL